MATYRDEDDDILGRSRVDFKIYEVRAAYRYRVMREAVLTPIFGTTWQEDGTKGVVRALGRLREMWEARLVSLRDAGWSALASRRAFVYMRNCPPFGVKTDTMGYHPCKRSMVCPFCYARNFVGEAYFYLELVLFGDANPYEANGHPRRHPYDGYRVLDFRLPVVRRAAEGFWTAAAIRDEHCPAFRAHMDRSRRAEVSLTAPLAGAVLYRVAPKRTAFAGVRGGVLLTKANGLPVELAPVYARTHGRWQLGPPSKAGLCAAFARAFAYPADMLTAPAWKVVAVLDGLRGAHMLSTYGKNNLVPSKRDGFKKWL